ncbi:unnamed protein product [Calicophoron daubneyi]|uniref:Deoxynucleotidyltransferase terminal-interacting protein 1 n=1 Tax=Calicophoron daubneyi TaxID=300641 RepID=A0AAV2TBB1_CALDB
MNSLPDASADRNNLFESSSSRKSPALCASSLNGLHSKILSPYSIPHFRSAQSTTAIFCHSESISSCPISTKNMCFGGSLAQANSKPVPNYPFGARRFPFYGPPSVNSDYPVLQFPPSSCSFHPPNHMPSNPSKLDGFYRPVDQSSLIQSVTSVMDSSRRLPFRCRSQFHNCCSAVQHSIPNDAVAPSSCQPTGIRCNTNSPLLTQKSVTSDFGRTNISQSHFPHSASASESAAVVACAGTPIICHTCCSLVTHTVNTTTESQIQLLENPYFTGVGAHDVDPQPVNSDNTHKVVSDSQSEPRTQNIPTPKIITTEKPKSSADPLVAAHPNTTGLPETLPHFNMRHVNVLHYPKYTNRRNSGFERRLRHNGLTLDPKLTLRFLRKLLQPFINRAVNNVLQHYMEEYILVAVRNIREHLGDAAVTDADLARFRQSVIYRVASQYVSKEDRLSRQKVNASDMQLPTLGLNPLRSSKDITARPIIPNSTYRRHPEPEISLHRHAVDHRALEANNTSSSEFHGDLDSHSSPHLSSVGSEGRVCTSQQCTISSSISQASKYNPGKSQTVDVPELASSSFPVSLHMPECLSSVSVQGATQVSAIDLKCTPRNPSENSIRLPSVVINQLDCDHYDEGLRHTASKSPSTASSCSTVGFFRDLPSSGESEVEGAAETSHYNPAHILEKERMKKSSDLAPRKLKRNGKRHAAWMNWGYAKISRAKPERLKKGCSNVPGENSDCLVEPESKVLTEDHVTTLCETSKSEVVDSKSLSSNCDRLCTSEVSEEIQMDNLSDPSFILNEHTSFTLGSSANVWLGLGAARGRIYTKHPELFRYQCDPEDKAWLVRNRILTSHGVKAYLMHSEQVRHIAQSSDVSARRDEGNSRLDDEELRSFGVPDWLLHKVQLTALAHPRFRKMLTSNVINELSANARSSSVDLRRTEKLTSTIDDFPHSSTGSAEERSKVVVPVLDSATRSPMAANVSQNSVPSEEAEDGHNAIRKSNAPELPEEPKILLRGLSTRKTLDMSEASTVSHSEDDQTPQAGLPPDQSVLQSLDQTKSSDHPSDSRVSSARPSLHPHISDTFRESPTPPKLQRFDYG